jgi:hypothetical protein
MAKKRVGMFMKRVKARRRGKMTIPLGVVAGFAPLAFTAVSDFKVHGGAYAAKAVGCNLTGFDLNGDGKWRPELGLWKIGLGPIVAGLLVHKFVGGSLGVNRALGRAKLPLLRL